MSDAERLEAMLSRLLTWADVMGGWESAVWADARELADDLRHSRPCISDGCKNRAPHNQGSDYCTACISADS